MIESNAAFSVSVERLLGGGAEIDASFESGPGVTALFGRSGAGKTSIVQMIAGLTAPDAGRIEIAGQVLFDSTKGIDVPAHRRRVGYVFQDGRLFPHMTARRNLLYGRWFARHAGSTLEFDQVVGLLGLEPLLERRPGALSGGEKQRVAIGRALLSNPSVLLLDEPLASLDGARKAEILPFLERLKEETGLPVIYVSHAMEEVIRLADTMVLVDEGRVVAAGTVEDLTSRLDLRPMTGRYEAGSVISATVEDHDEAYELTHLRIGKSVITVPLVHLPAGAVLRVRIRARDVTLSLDTAKETSSLNIFRGEVKQVATAQGAFVDVLVDCEGISLWARVTRYSVDKLGLSPGRKVYASVKAGAIDRASLGQAR